MTTTEPTAAEAHALALRALEVAEDALHKAKDALSRATAAEASAETTKAAVVRCVDQINALKVTIDGHHTDTLRAIEGAKIGLAAREQADAQHDAKIARIESRLTILDLVKISIAGGGGSIVVAIVLGLIAMLTGRPMPQPTPQAAPQTTIYVPAPGATP